MLPRPGRALALLALIALIVTACGSTAQQSPSPSGRARASAAAKATARTSAKPKPKPTPRATPTVTPSPAPDAGRRWSTLPAVPALGTATIRALTVTPSGLLASGHVAVPAQRRLEGAILLSVDGRSWRRVTSRRGFDGASVGEIIRGPGGYIATGSSCGFESDCAGVRLWSSKDGIRWGAVSVNFAPATKVTLLAGKSRWVAIGSSSEIDAGPPAVWTSPNGRTWAKGSIDGTPAVITSGLTLPTRFVAYGTVYPNPDRPEPAAWTSADGIKWMRVQRNLAPQGTGGEALALHNGQLVAFAATATGLELWTSKDGMSWRLEPGASSPFELDGAREVRNLNVVRAGRNVVAFGAVVDAAAQIAPVGVWISGDGVVWDKADDTSPFQDATVNDAIMFRGELVAVGSVNCVDNCSGPQFWVSPPR